MLMQKNVHVYAYVCACARACVRMGMAIVLVCLRVSCRAPPRPPALDPPLNTTHDLPVKVHGLFSVHRLCVPFARGRATSIQYSASPTGGTTVSRHVMSLQICSVINDRWCNHLRVTDSPPHFSSAPNPNLTLT